LVTGASTQISFVAPNAAHDVYNLTLFDTEYDTYSHSYLCYGTEQLRLIYLGQLVNKANGSLSIDEPCLQDGFVQNLTYSDIFDTPCAQNQYAPLPDLNTSSTYSFMYEYFLNIF
jgi:adenosinetriphosphatase